MIAPRNMQCIYMYRLFNLNSNASFLKTENQQTWMWNKRFENNCMFPPQSAGVQDYSVILYTRRRKSRVIQVERKMENTSEMAGFEHSFQSQTTGKCHAHQQDRVKLPTSENKCTIRPPVLQIKNGGAFFLQKCIFRWTDYMIAAGKTIHSYMTDRMHFNKKDVNVHNTSGRRGGEGGWGQKVHIYFGALPSCWPPPDQTVWHLQPQKIGDFVRHCLSR